LLMAYCFLGELSRPARRNPRRQRVLRPCVCNFYGAGERMERARAVGAATALTVANGGAELVRRCRAGDGTAWEEIVSLYTRRVYNLAYRFTSRMDAAEDLTQEVFIRVYRSLEQYDPKQGDLQNWLMR